MPLLEQRRRSFETDSVIARSLASLFRLFVSIPEIFDFSPGRYWALLWAILHLCGFVSGSILGGWEFFGSVVLLSRISCLLPCLLGFFPRKFCIVLWVLVFVLGFGAGSLEKQERQVRSAATAPSAWSVATEVCYNGNGIFRPTAWAKAGSDSFWQTPAILLAWKPASQKGSKTLEPRPGQSIVISGKGKTPEPGQIIGASLKIRVPKSQPLPSIFDDRRYLQGRGIYWRAKSFSAFPLQHSEGLISGIMKVVGKFRQKVLAAIERDVPSPESHLMMAVLLGARSPMAREAAQPFSRLGLSHLFAVSGLHVGIMMGILLLPLVITKIWAGWRLIPAGIFLPFYIVLTGAPGSVIRASGMTLLLLLTFPLGRRSHSLQLLGLLFWGGIIWQPIQVLDPGLRLSYLATGGIIAVVGIINGSTGSFWKSKTGKVLMGLVVSLAAQWFTFPQVATSFGYFSGISPLANLLTVPLFGLSVWTLVLGLACGALVPSLGQSLMSWTWFIVRALTGLLDKTTPWTQPWTMTFPNPGIADGLVWGTGTVIVLVSLKKWSEGKVKGSLTILVVAIVFASVLIQFQWGALGNPAPGTIQIWQFDVGQGDCALIHFPDNWCGIIDTAGSTGWGGSQSASVLERQVNPWLQRQHIEEICALVITHDHWDHTAGASELLDNYPVRTVYTGGKFGRSISDRNFTSQILTPASGEVLHRWQDWELSFIQPDTLLTSHLHENDKSLVLVLKQNNEVRMVWTGDMEETEEAILLNSPLMPRNIGVLKAGHHGSNTSSSQEFLDVLDPQLVLISCGVGNKYHHPSHGPFIVQGDTIPVLRTDLCGSIHLYWDQQGDLHFETEKAEGVLPKP